jgi:hypothetical protein
MRETNSANKQGLYVDKFKTIITQGEIDLLEKIYRKILAPAQEKDDANFPMVQTYCEFVDKLNKSFKRSRKRRKTTKWIKDSMSEV